MWLHCTADPDGIPAHGAGSAENLHTTDDAPRRIQTYYPSWPALDTAPGKPMKRVRCARNTLTVSAHLHRAGERPKPFLAFQQPLAAHAEWQMPDDRSQQLYDEVIKTTPTQ